MESSGILSNDPAIAETNTSHRRRIGGMDRKNARSEHTHRDIAMSLRRASIHNPRRTLAKERRYHPSPPQRSQQTSLRISHRQHIARCLFMNLNKYNLFIEYPLPTNRGRSNEGSKPRARRSNDYTSLGLARRFRRDIHF